MQTENGDTVSIETLELQNEVYEAAIDLWVVCNAYIPACTEDACGCGTVFAPLAEATGWFADWNDDTKSVETQPLADQRIGLEELLGYWTQAHDEGITVPGSVEFAWIRLMSAAAAHEAKLAEEAGR